MSEDRILLDLYAAAESEARWTPMLDALCSTLSVRSAVVQVIEETGTAGWETWTARDSRSLVDAELHDSCLNRPDSPRFRIRPSLRPPADVASDRRAFGAADGIMEDLLDRLDRARLGIGMWASFPMDERRSFTLILHRYPGDTRDLQETEEQYLRGLLPHLQQSVRLSRAIGHWRARADSLALASGHLHAGLILCDPDLSIDWCNATAIDILARTSLLSSVAGRIRCARADDTQRLRAGVQAVAAGLRDSGQLLIASGDGPSLHVRIARAAAAVDSSVIHGNALVALMLALPSARTCFDPNDVAELFGLSPAEARLTSALAGGSSITEYATARGISVGTARVQLNRILSKTETQRQAELVRIVHNSSASRRAAPAH